MFEPRPSTAECLKPFYQSLSDFSVPRDSRPALPRAMGILGYRFVKRDEETATSYYARPWLLWAIMRLRQKMREVYWASLDWLYHRGIIHWRTPECLPSRWRDLGLGPTPKDR